MTMNLAGNDGNNCSFEDRLASYGELTDNQKFSLVNTMCLLTNARLGDRVGDHAVQQMFTAFRYIENEDLQDMMLSEIQYASKQSGRTPAPQDTMYWIAEYVKRPDADMRIENELMNIALPLMEMVKDWDKDKIPEDDRNNRGKQTVKYFMEALHAHTGKQVTQQSEEYTHRKAPEKIYIPRPTSQPE